MAENGNHHDDQHEQCQEPPINRFGFYAHQTQLEFDRVLFGCSRHIGLHHVSSAGKTCMAFPLCAANVIDKELASQCTRILRYVKHRTLIKNSFRYQTLKPIFGSK